MDMYMYSNVHYFCLIVCFFHFIILIRQSKQSLDLMCQRETGFKNKNKNQTCIFTLAYGKGLKV